MMSLALEQGVLAVFKHNYSWNTEVKLQDEGAPIGLTISGASDKVAMLAWVREFQLRLMEATETIPDHEPYLHQLYVDNNSGIMEELPPGTRLIEGKFRVLEKLVAEDTRVKGDRRTAELVKELANSICPYLQMDVDFPSNHTSRWMPILDSEVQMASDKSVNWKW